MKHENKPCTRMDRDSMIAMLNWCSLRFGWTEQKKELASKERSVEWTLKQMAHNKRVYMWSNVTSTERGLFLSFVCNEHAQYCIYVCRSKTIRVKQSSERKKYNERYIKTRKNLFISFQMPRMLALCYWMLSYKCTHIYSVDWVLKATNIEWNLKNHLPLLHSHLWLVCLLPLFRYIDVLCVYERRNRSKTTIQTYRKKVNTRIRWNEKYSQRWDVKR